MLSAVGSGNHTWTLRIDTQRETGIKWQKEPWKYLDKDFKEPLEMPLFQTTYKVKKGTESRNQKKDE